MAMALGRSSVVDARGLSLLEQTTGDGQLTDRHC
jgi:hypothetical protein